MTMSALRAPIDYKSLEEELHAALTADELYKLQNDAKLRAVEQGVPTYEHFRQMVNAAHLKPLERNDMKPKIGVQWNPVTNRTRYPTVSATSKISKFIRDDKHKSVRPSEPCEDFLRCWRTIEDHSKRFAYMWNLRHVLQTRIFRVEIPAFFLGDFVSVCLDCVSKMDDTTQITELLRILNTCSRFDLTICFMTKDEQVTCKQLFKQLRLKERSQDKLVEDALVLLAAKYRIDLD